MERERERIWKKGEIATVTGEKERDQEVKVSKA